MKQMRVEVLDASKLGFADLDVSNYLDRHPAALIRFVNITEALSREGISFRGGGYWEAMHGEMSGFFEIRFRIGGIHNRFFCRFIRGENQLILVIAAAGKASGTLLQPSFYKRVRELDQKAMQLGIDSFY